MRVQLIVALIAVTGTSGLAVAVSLPAPLELPLLAPSAETVIELAAPPAPVAPRSPAREAASAIALAEQAGAAPAEARGTIERVYTLPRHLLLSDGALVATFAAAPGEHALEGGMVLRALPTLPRDLAPAPLPTGAMVAAAEPAARDETATMAAPAAAQPDEARVFEPPARDAETRLRIAWAGGIALGAAALLGFVLYHRIRPNAALENETRKVIFEAVCAQPGLGVHEISRLAGVSYSTTTYHLERLVGAGMIVMTPDGNKLCYYKNGGAFSESERRILPILKNEEAARLFDAIVEAPGTYRAALAEKLGVTATTINWHLKRLREAGLVDETRAGRSAHLYARVEALRPTLLALATKVEPSEPSIAQKLRGYAGAAPEPSGVGAA